MKDPVPLFGAVLAMIVVWNVYKYSRSRKPVSHRDAQSRSSGSGASTVSTGADCSDGGSSSCGGDGCGGGGD